MFLDLANYTKTTAELSKEKFNELHDHFDGLVLPIVESHQGDVIKKIGDAFLVTFESAPDAIHCSLDLQKAFAIHRTKKSFTHPLHIRIALHTGDVLLRKGDVYGETVNITARIEGVAVQDHIIISRSTYHTINQNEFNVRSIGKHTLKGLKAPLELYQIFTPKQYHVYQKSLRKKARIRFFKKIKHHLFKVAVLAIVAIIIYFLWKKAF